MNKYRNEAAVLKRNGNPAAELNNCRILTAEMKGSRVAVTALTGSGVALADMKGCTNAAASMRIYRIAAALLISIVLIVCSAVTSLAETHSFKGECSYDGSSIVSDFDSDAFAAAINELQPGDDLHYTVTYGNTSKSYADFYMRNEVLTTLEDHKSQAENGGYTYVLKNIGPDGTETVLFDNSDVGGEVVKGGLEGLKQATSATKNYFFIQQLKPGEEGKTVLYVLFDGETEVNDYMDTFGDLMISYAVEDMGKDGKTTTDKSGKILKDKGSKKNRKPGSDSDRSGGNSTGDTSHILVFAAIEIMAVLMLIAAIAIRRKENRALAAERAAAQSASGSARANRSAENAGGSGNAGTQNSANVQSVAVGAGSTGVQNSADNAAGSGNTGAQISAGANHNADAQNSAGAKIGAGESRRGGTDR